MKEAQGGWSRRAFVQGIGYASTVRGVSLAAAERSAVGYTMSLADNALNVFAIDGDHWTRIQTLSSRAPVFAAMHPNRRSLYVVNQVDEHDGLPRGTVESYSIESSGRLTLSRLQPLSLSATRPRHLAISPNGRRVIVTVHGGGAYNVL